MPLEEYRRKRRFGVTSEPRGADKKARRARKLRFVVQKHRATALHYDFRLEWDGVLLSWAVPKGPSLDPSVKRLAMAVEDHPLEYARFEGVIPAGEYGGGTVMVWDEGTYEPAEPDVGKSLQRGEIKFALHGKKLEGSWVLVRTRGYQGGKSWLLIKHRDEAAIDRRRHRGGAALGEERPPARRDRLRGGRRRPPGSERRPGVGNRGRARRSAHRQAETQTGAGGLALESPAVSDEPATSVAPAADASSFRLGVWLFVRAVGAIYLIAFLSLRVQILGLYGSRGILPIGELLAAAASRLGPERYWLLPSLTWLGAGDATLTLLCDAGAVLALAVVLGLAPGPCLLALWALYLSLVSVGRVFLSFQWDMLLLETGLLAVLVAPWSLRPRLATMPAPPALGVWLVRWLLFRLMFASGVVKLVHDDPALPTWHDLTALAYHYETQCLPPWTAWYAHHLPLWWHRLSCAAMFVIELAVPFLIFGPRRARLLAGVVLIGFQLLIITTGNYTFFNWLTIALCLPLFDDRALAGVLPRRSTSEALAVPPPAGWTRAALTTPLALVLLIASALTFGQQLGGRGAVPPAARVLLEWLAPLRSVNGYGLFARMTTVRNEIVVEGSDDGVTWKPYELRWKPGDVMRRPRFVAPHQPRLDWQMWFAALTPYRGNPERWFARFLSRLLEGEPTVIALLASNPFPETPPRHVRASFFQYRFSEVGAADGAWWRREPRGEYAPVISRRSTP